MTRLLAPLLLVGSLGPTVWAADDNPYKAAQIGDSATFKVSTKSQGVEKGGTITHVVSAKNDRNSCSRSRGRWTASRHRPRARRST